MGLGAKAESLGNFVFHSFQAGTFELHDFVAVLADNMIMPGMIGVIGVVEFVVFAEVHFADQPTFGEQGEGAVDCGARDGLVLTACPREQLFSGEMLAGAEGGIDDRAPLRGQAQAFARQKLDEPLFGALGASVCHAKIIVFQNQPSQRGLAGWRGEKKNLNRSKQR